MPTAYLTWQDKIILFLYCLTSIQKPKTTSYKTSYLVTFQNLTHKVYNAAN